MSDVSPKGPPQTGGTLHEIRWNEIFPWLILVKALRVTLMLRVLVLATIGVWLTNWGDTAIQAIFAGEMTSLERTIVPANTSQFIQLYVVVEQPNGDSIVRPQAGPLLQAWRWVTKPFRLLADRKLSWQSSLLMLTHGLWTIGVWGIFGGAIARIAALYLTREETLGPLVALRDAATVWPSTTGAPTIVLLVATAMAVPLVLLGFLLQWNTLALVAGLLWCLILAGGLVLAVVLAGLLVGWPLMWACLGVERSDAFDGVSRCYAYVYQRPLHLAFYVLVAALLAFFGNVVVYFFASATITASESALSWGAGNARLDELLNADSSLLANRAVNGWKWGLMSLVAAYPLACLWPMAVGIYLLLRRQVDATEMDEVTLATASPKSLPTHDPTAPE